jgi:tRNA nucleotidyltransferase (CCA-adding enzyme)
LDKFDEVCNVVRRRIVPSQRLRLAVEAKAEEIRKAVERECRSAELSAEVRLDGSVAKDTWVVGYEEADIFMRVSPELSKKQLQDICLPIARKALAPNPVVERFAEHPYIESTVKTRGGQLRVNVVPCYRVEKGNWLSATDRSPYHTEYIRSHLNDVKRDEVRLMKAFLRAIQAYGADIKTGGFSGMLCETLIVSYGAFRKVVTDFSEWCEDRFIDVENCYEGRGGEVHRVFREPLVVIDPVDKGRNLGAAVRRDQLWNFVGASRQLLTKPSPSQFADRRTKPVTASQYRNLIKRRGSTIVCLATGRIDAVVDILWSQLYKTQRALVQILESNDFKVIRSTAWSDEKRLNVILFELEEERLPASKRREGPPVERSAESASFLSKHMDKLGTVSGPWIGHDRWIVHKMRTNTSAVKLLATTLRSGGTNVGVAALFAKSFKEDLRMLEDQAISSLISSNDEFAKFMRSYLSGRPVWLA